MRDGALGRAICACDICYRQGLLPPGPEYRPRNRELFERFLPAKVRLLFLAESPPISGAYFYRVPEWSRRGVPSALFWEMARALGLAPDGPRDYERKEEYLRAFAARGLAIVDAARCPVNQVTDSVANRVIENCGTFLRREIEEREPPFLVLVKSTNRPLVRRLEAWGLAERLLDREPLHFPVAGNQGRFREDIERMRRQHPEAAPLLGA
ncbi:MAG: hypothetical protein M1401_19270 [Chloroflexi bacterium]|nr:hypothetical protein [Chloroflexota bacterium]MCL5110962.1 hypothetical protein [Chloroflexota bacterium]